MKIKMNVLCKSADYSKPRRAHWFDAGLDCYAATIKTVKPGETARIPLGFSLEIPHGNVVLLTPRSSLNAKGLDVKLGTIDADYTGEISAVIHNTTSENFEIGFGTKICQLIMLPIHEMEVIEAEEFDIYDNRSVNGFGSTDKSDKPHDAGKSISDMPSKLLCSNNVDKKC